MQPEPTSMSKRDKAFMAILVMFKTLYLKATLYLKIFLAQRIPLSTSDYHIPMCTPQNTDSKDLRF